MASTGDQGPDLKRFEAVVVRYVHDVRTGERLNIGVLLLCEGRAYVGAKFLEQWGRVTGAFHGADHVLLDRAARAFERACELRTGTLRNGNSQTWLGSWQPVEFAKTVIHADPDGAIRFSHPLSGPTADPERTLEELYCVHVQRPKPLPEHASRTDNEVWKGFAQRLRQHEASLLGHLTPHEVAGANGSRMFKYAWKNGVWNVAEPVSLDLLDTSAIRAKAYEYAGIYSVLRPKEHGASAHLIVGLPPETSPTAVKRAADVAVRDLRTGLRGEAEVVPENEVGGLINKIANDVYHAAEAGELKARHRPAPAGRVEADELPAVAASPRPWAAS